jgi:hypothetical protein
VKPILAEWSSVVTQSRSALAICRDPQEPAFPHEDKMRGEIGIGPDIGIPGHARIAAGDQADQLAHRER